MGNSNLKQNIDEFKVINNVWFFHYDGIEIMVMKIPNSDYWAGVDGHIYSLKGRKLRRLQSADNRNGYLRVNISLKGERKNEYVHRLIADAWLEDGGFDCQQNPRHEINHLDGVKGNNKLCNLERCSTKENKRHLNKVLRSLDFEVRRIHN